MAFATEFHMPGAYHFDPTTTSSATTSSQPLSATMFRPPMSTSASSSVYNLAKSTGSLYSDVSMANNTPGPGVKRKRTGAEVSRASTPNADWGLAVDGGGDIRPEQSRNTRGDGGNGGGAREIRYILAGQIDTPSGPPLTAENGILEDSVYSDIDYRRALGSKRPHDELESPSVRFAGLHLETPIQLQEPPVTPRQVGWSTLALSTIGGVVGKVWDFCRGGGGGGGFRGFQAGGGERYGPDGGVSTPSRGGGGGGGHTWCNEHDVPTLETDDDDNYAARHNVPGGFPQQLEYVSLHELSTPDSTPRPAVKRRQTSATMQQGGDELRRNWVIVDEQQASSPSAAAAPKQATHNIRPSSSASFATNNKPSSRPSIRPGMSRAGPRYSTPTASSSSRRISVPVSRLGGGTPSAASSRGNTRNSLRISHAGSPALSSREPASYAAPRSPSSFQQNNSKNPSSPSRIPLPTNPSTGSDPSHSYNHSINPFAIRGTTSIPAARPSSRQTHSRMGSRCASPAPFSSSHKRNASTASTSTPRLNSRADSGTMQDSPRLSAEAVQLAARKLAAERDADAKMEALNRKLMDMIRQGKEALGTTVEVDMEFGAPTAGWEDDD